MAREFVAYEGEAYSIEWFFSANNSQPLDYYNGLSQTDRIKVLRLFKLMGDTGKIRDEAKFRYEGEKVYAFKPQPHRFLSFFIHEGKIIVTNAFRKKQNKLPVREHTKAKKCRVSYLERVKLGIYHEEQVKK